jgi:mannosyltransferase OCH1-like enzyme
MVFSTIFCTKLLQLENTYQTNTFNTKKERKMQIGAITTNRLSKLIGAGIKGIGYLFHFFFPKKRFTIPFIRKPLFTGKTLLVPKIIWQTNYTNEVTLPVYVNYLFNRLMSLDWEYRYVTTEERLIFIKTHASDRVFNAFEKLTDGASQADFWRLLTLNQVGGVYIDIDAHAVWPLSLMIQPSDRELLLMTKHRYSNYFIASQPNNPHLLNTLDIVVNNIEQRNISDGVYSLTGPAALNKAIENESETNYRHNKYTCIQGSFTNEHFQYIDKPRGKWIYKKQDELLK